MCAEKKLKFFTAYDPPPSPSVDFKAASLTRQEFAAEADLNNIMAKYAAGMAPIPSGDRAPLFGDFSELGDYQENLQRMIDAQDRFMQLPSKLRERFGNDPGLLLDFLNDEQNRDEAVKLGLISAPAPKPVDSMPPTDEKPGEA